MAGTRAASKTKLARLRKATKAGRHPVDPKRSKGGKTSIKEPRAGYGRALGKTALELSGARGAGKVAGKAGRMGAGLARKAMTRGGNTAKPMPRMERQSIRATRMKPKSPLPNNLAEAARKAKPKTAVRTRTQGSKKIREMMARKRAAKGR